jgi:putative spermidine/putrescine transport system ATP-binding protein
MSDRLAVFNHGRVEQVGTPGAVYENPGNEFVAGFVGVSNLIRGDLARQLRGSPEPFTVRPERIQILEAEEPAPVGSCEVEGVVAAATYLGAFSRFQVAIGDTALTVVSQNLEVGYDQVKALTEQRVRLSWDQDSCRPLAGAEQPAPATAGVTE